MSLTQEVLTYQNYLRVREATIRIQKMWIGFKVRSRLPALRKYQVANLNAGHHLEISDLNNRGFWSQTEKSTQQRKITFSGTILKLKEEKLSEEVTDFTERGKRPLCNAFKVVEAAVYKKPIFPIFMGEGMQSPELVDVILRDIMKTLASGNTYRFCNSSSTKLKSNPSSQTAIKTAYVKFRYFSGLGPYIPTLEERIQELKNMPYFSIEAPTTKAAPATKATSPLLVRQASRSPYCMVRPLVPPAKEDDLEIRYKKLLGL